MRVLFLTLYPDIGASPRYRVTQFLPYLRANGVACTVACALTARQLAALTGPRRQRRPLWYHVAETPRRLGHILAAKRYDVVFVQKALMTAYLRGLPSLLQTRARRIVYDIDDAVHLAPPHPLRPVWRLLEDRAQIEKLMGIADLVLAGNGWLAEVAKKAGTRTLLFPTVVDTERFVPASEPPGTYRIGWIGNPSTMVCLEPALEALSELRDASIYLVGADAAGAPLPQAVTRPWSLGSEVADVQSFCVGIMPMPKKEWMRGKCGLKALLYMACGIPCVASPFGAALEIIKHDENGLFADSPGDWRDAFARLRDPALRRRLGEAGRATVEERYSLKRAAPRLLDLLESV